MFSILHVLFVAFLPWFPAEASSPLGGVNKATFDAIKVGMTAQEIQGLIGGRRAPKPWIFYDYSEVELWHDDADQRRIWVEYEPTVDDGRVTRATFVDYSTTPDTHFELRRVATKEECAGAIDRLIADGLRKDPLQYSDTFTKQIPVDGPRATKTIQDHPDYRCYHLLMALRTTNPSAYQAISASVRASVLCSTLKKQRCFDDWVGADEETVKPYAVTESEKALIECGVAAIRYLLPLLDDHTDAFLTEYENEDEREDYRRADYAFRYVSWILSIPYAFQEEPADRDKDIVALKTKLAGGSSSRKR